MCTFVCISFQIYRSPSNVIVTSCILLGKGQTFRIPLIIEDILTAALGIFLLREWSAGLGQQQKLTAFGNCSNQNWRFIQPMKPQPKPLPETGPTPKLVSDIQVQSHPDILDPRPEPKPKHSSPDDPNCLNCFLNADCYDKSDLYNPKTCGKFRNFTAEEFLGSEW